jgi:hypothetical protein
MDFVNILTSGVVAALVSGLIALRNNERKIVVENVTQERTKWRDKIREKNSQMQKAFDARDIPLMKAVACDLRLLLNPFDPEDERILSDAARLWAEGAAEEDFSRFSVRLALLLKHDWERAKQEARSAVFRRRRNEKRRSFEEWMNLHPEHRNLALAKHDRIGKEDPDALLNSAQQLEQLQIEQQSSRQEET